MLIDIHSHLDHCYFEDDLDKVIDNAVKANVKVILTAGTNPGKNRVSLKLAEKYGIVKACLGIHPVQYGDKKSIIKNKQSKSIKNDNLSKIDIDKEMKFIEKNKNKIIAIGEVGLDYFWDKDNKKQQQELFEKMISLAEKLNKPIIVHSRKAESDTIEKLRSSKLKKVIIHSFTGKKSLVKEIVDNGWFITAPTCIVRSTQFQDNVKLAPINQIFCETDAPYLTPFKDKRNEPAFVAEAYKKLAEVKKMELKEVINNIWMNWQKVFE